ncbi:Aldehyde ferredoxin oxidoreductase [Geobacter metallireducens RCH3]|uniref:Benzoyl-CoA reductase, putative n=1 Tax=Geobacter metallireducens (strain ATCC 53774 / DSM 7210 / GS-15) TaxID=269799 RepID=Q39TV8_GEOMG|nr:aldehyde ferredoxin oxidoreductase N-terminal domain-containing protein [Geobacter metallireducens]4Z3W_A Chain A, Benzoyl-CoA reductase, putative [Geobacter metallireducens GS-15]4Z3W_B Chain B, Benzoyl-CoA reductase, putative [Geobacter metallireducens GS-15]4Z3W_C Chain C, Benzoyl-CoA reductase, putative [Geobacter metallireducens GS-15]4Z3W_D Chain D, Benzoyl-CoA reductase, putative [Geobacter metallireducens GS-15]4Z3X_A Chain A, Benzoyl-CoA reductase, putative [Geobacter metallireduce
MRYAETGYVLEVDLTKGSIERVATDPRDTELYLGGLGTNAKILWDRVPPEVEPFSPENLLIFAAGLLCGTPATGCNRTIVSTVSPQTKLMAFSMMGGFWAPELKYAGYDKIIFRGKSPELVYLYINNDKVEIRDASHLKGKGAIETAEIIKKELNEPRAQVAAIGKAGENRVFYASIEQGRSSASRGGIGAVMGDKGLKAVVVRGTKDLCVAKPEEYIGLCNEVLDYIKHREENPIPDVMPILAGLGSPQEMKVHDEKWHTENFNWGNARTRRKDFWTDEVSHAWEKTMDKARTRLISCYNCPMKCGATISMEGLPTYMMKCFTKLTYTMAAYSDLDFGLRIAQKATEYGLDGFSAPQVMAFAFELLEKGILKDSDFPGLPEGNEERFFYLLDKIVNRDGIGDILANGTYWAAQEIGNGAEDYAHNNIKKHEQLPLKLSMLNPIYYLMYCTGEKINITQIEGQFPQAPYPKLEQREAFVEDWIQVPDEKFKKIFLEWEPRGEKSMPNFPTVDMCCDIVDWQEMMHYIDDALGQCAGLSSFPLKPPYHIHNYPKFIAAGAGIEMDTEKLKKAAKRYRTLVRAFNIRRGMRRVDEQPPANHWKNRFPELEKELLDSYYKLKGWNDDGIPTKETLDDLGLGYVGDEFIKRGILSAG